MSAFSLCSSGPIPSFFPVVRLTATGIAVLFAYHFTCGPGGREGRGSPKKPLIKPLIWPYLGFIWAPSPSLPPPTCGVTAAMLKYWVLMCSARCWVASLGMEFGDEYIRMLMHAAYVRTCIRGATGLTFKCLLATCKEKAHRNQRTLSPGIEPSGTPLKAAPSHTRAYLGTPSSKTSSKKKTIPSTKSKQQPFSPARTYQPKIMERNVGAISKHDGVPNDLPPLPNAKITQTSTPNSSCSQQLLSIGSFANHGGPCLGSQIKLPSGGQGIAAHERGAKIEEQLTGKPVVVVKPDRNKQTYGEKRASTSWETNEGTSPPPLPPSSKNPSPSTQNPSPPSPPPKTPPPPPLPQKTPPPSPLPQKPLPPRRCQRVLPSGASLRKVLILVWCCRCCASRPRSSDSKTLRRSA